MTEDDLRPAGDDDTPLVRGPRSARRQSRRASMPEGAARRRSPRKGLIAAVVLVVVVALLAFGVWWTVYRAEASVAPGRTVTIDVPSGASSSEVAAMLSSKGVVANSMMFRLRAQEMGALAQLKPGAYEFKTGSDYGPVIRQLEAGPTVVYATLAIPEGWSIEQIARRVQEKCGIPAAEFTKLATTGRSQFDFAFLQDDPTPSLQGYLFPKTYQVRQGSTAADVIRMMLAQYGTETASVDLTYAKSKNLTLHDVTTIASIIEHEVYVDKDRKTVASVIYNRLHIHMRLQLDSTVQYALNGKATLSLADLQTPSPYNTYVNYGLPPGPIDNPGLAAIQAAAAPAKTPYLYYILTHKDGSQSFTTNYAAFLVLKAQAAKGLK
jgi:UPF0755 protein